jgi:hypothetical protein
VQVTVADSNYSTTNSRSYSLTIDPALSITSPATLPNGALGAAYTATTAKAMGGSGSYAWFASGLPGGMIIGTTTGTISGTPTSATGSPFSVTVTVEDSNSAAANASYTLTIKPPPLAISGPAFLPAGVLGTAYIATKVTASGGSGTYTWSATGLPSGLMIGPNSGGISGTPTSTAGSPFSVTVTVNDGNTTAYQIFPLVVSAFSACDVNRRGNINVGDVQSIINKALGGMAPNNDLNNDGVVNVVDVQILINAVLGGVCPAF